MAKELAHFKNFAKLQDTSVAFNDITVIAGKPGTGKSYVMKMMYAQQITPLVTIERSVEIFNSIVSQKIGVTKDEKLLFKFIDDIKEKELKRLEEKAKKITNEGTLKNILQSIFLSLDQISNTFSVETKHQIVQYDQEIKIVHKIDQETDIDTLSDLGEVVFVETPLILEFKKFIKREEGKTPYHIESLLNILDTDYSFTDAEQDKFIKEFTHKSKEIIHGNIENTGDSFLFNKANDKNYDIVNTSSGTKSIGLLQYLVTNKALKKGSVLYWEEPEVHLHPEWQLRMIELFVELMHAGVKIVFSTHSPYMCEYLNAISQKQGFADRVSFNLFEETSGAVKNHILENDDDWNKIQAELLDPLEEIMWEYL